MALMTEPERAFARVLANLVLVNPFLPDWVRTQREALGPDFVPAPPVWHALPGQPARNQNITALTARLETFAGTLRARLVAHADPGPEESALYQDLASAFLGGAWTVEETVRRYCTLVFAQTGNYQETARRLGIDWRTVKEKVDRKLLEQLTGPDVARRETT